MLITIVGTARDRANSKESVLGVAKYIADFRVAELFLSPLKELSPDFCFRILACQDCLVGVCQKNPTPKIQRGKIVTIRDLN